MINHCNTCKCEIPDDDAYCESCQINNEENRTWRAKTIRKPKEKIIVKESYNLRSKKNKNH